MRLKLESSEHSVVEQIVYKYREIGTEMNEIQSKLKDLETQKESLMYRLENVQLEEKNLFSDLREKYGEGKLDLLTLEYVK